VPIKGKHPLLMVTSAVAIFSSSSKRNNPQSKSLYQKDVNRHAFHGQTKTMAIHEVRCRLCMDKPKLWRFMEYAVVFV
jgi:hypothetical protein